MLDIFKLKFWKHSYCWICIGAIVLVLPMPCKTEQNNAPQPEVSLPIAFGECLTFDKAYEDISARSLVLKAAEEEFYARSAERTQAKAYPNPALTASLDKIGRSIDGEENELFLGITQPIELGGKRSARIRVANADQDAAYWNLRIIESELFAKALHAFIDTAVAQEKVSLTRQQQLVSEQTLSCVEQKTATGKTSLLEMKKAELACRSAKLLLSKQLSDLTISRKQLLLLWEDTQPSVDCVSFALYDIEAPPALETLTGCLANNPELAKSRALLNRSSEIVSLERSIRIPDIAIQIGVMAERFTQEPTLSVGIDIPLPIFDQNKGNICRAIHEQSQALYNQMLIERQLSVRLEVLYEEWLAAYDQAIALKTGIMPTATESYLLAQQSYEEGRFSYLDLLDAKLTLFTVQQQYLQAAEQYHHTKADVLKLIGF